jgi:DNA-binding CsgD family transcriptional regulator
MHLPSNDNALPTLTATEQRCLALAAEGRTPGEIVSETDMSMQLVAEALRSAIDKLDAKNVTGAITRAVRFKLI